MKRNPNPFRLNADEKPAVVNLYARFATTTQVIDEVIKWKSEATTGDPKKDRKYVTDAIRTCNPNSSAFSHQVTLTARRTEYLAETQGTFVTTVSSIVSTLSTELAELKFDFSTVSVADLTKIVTALKDLHSLMEQLGIAHNAAVSEAVDFHRRLDEYPENQNGDPMEQTRREMLEETEAYESIVSEQIDNGTNRNHIDIDIDHYPENYEFPDFIVEQAWKVLFAADKRKPPSIAQMRKEILEAAFPDGKINGKHWSELAGFSVEKRLDQRRGYLSYRRRSVPASEIKKWWEEHDKSKAGSAIPLDKMTREKAERAETRATLEKLKAKENKNGKITKDNLG